MLADFQGYRGGHLPGNCLSQYFGIFIWRVKMNAVILLRIVLIAFTICSALFLIVDLIKHKDEIHFKKGITLALIGLFTNMLDTWGIGCFATQSACFKFTKSTNDEIIPGTLNVGNTIPVALEGILFMTFVDIDPLTLYLMLAAAAIGALVGSGIVCKWDLKTVRYALSVGLVILAVALVCKNAGVGPFGAVGTATGLSGIKLVVGVVINFFLGALMMIGVGLYAPCIALVGALGMNIGVAFPIMMGSCAFLMNASCFKFIKEGKYDRTATIMLSIFGCIGVVIAYKVACFLSLSTLTYIVCVVMIITSATFFRDARKMSMPSESERAQKELQKSGAMTD